ncbi:MAG: 50S ribosomal protein L11 methyltransferase [Muribaculaceae bacterium]|nr:50S ribosomal protein L11 methyltransferase [Muribaculaceae bacterium]
MYDYRSVRIDIKECNVDITDLLAAFLADEGFETFEPDERGLTGYIRDDRYNKEVVEAILREFPMPVDYKLESKVIKGEDWNREWELNYFKPIVIDGKCVIHSSFHQDVPEAVIDIVIDPKMAFGTGHHFTTSNMIRLLLDEPMQGKTVIDIGTGTGILAILCKKKGCAKATGVEIDEFAYQNACENGVLNNEKIEWICGDAESIDNLEPVDYILANINLNVILNDMGKYKSKLKPDGSMMLSGFYEKDLPSVMEKASAIGLRLEKTITENNWVAIKLSPM